MTSFVGRCGVLLLAQVLAACLLAQEPLRGIDLDGDTGRQVTVFRQARQYHGHPTTALLADGKTMLCVHPQGHGRGAILLQRSSDGGRSWSQPLPVPDNWATSQETPTIHRLRDPRSGNSRLLLFSGLYPIRSSVSEDDGRSWTPLQPIGDFGGIVAMASLIELRDGSHAAYFHDDGRYLREGGRRSQFTVYQTRSTDGGLHWSEPLVVWTGKDMDLCEPGVVRSPDGKQLAMLLRENSRRQASQVMFSDDESATWSSPKPLSAALTGDRHVAAYAPDGRLLVSFRDMDAKSPTKGDWVAWVGRYEDLAAGGSGSYRIRLSRNFHAWDCGYPGVEVLPDGEFVLVSYGYWEPGESPFVRAVRLRLDELKALADQGQPDWSRPAGTVRPTARLQDWWQQRVAEDLRAAQLGGYRMVFLGDSITEGWRDVGKAAWAEHWQPRRALNLGIGGDKTQNLLWRLDAGLLAALASPANDINHVVLMIGTNNSNGEEQTAAEIAEGIVAIVRRLRTGLPQARVLLLAIFPRGEQPGPQRQKNAEASALAAKALAGDPMVRYRDIGKIFLDAEDRLTKQVMPDFLHLSAAAYQKWAVAIAGEFDD